MKIAKSLKNLIVPFVFSGFLLGSPLYSQTADFQKNLTEKFSTNLEKRIFNENPLSNEKRDKYAILISGDSDPKYEQNLFLAYKTFMNNGFKQKNIYVLGSSGKYSSMYPVDSPASKKSIKTLFEYLSKKVDSEDLIFVYTTGHGDISKFNGKNEATLTFSDQENFSAQEFIDNLKKINPKEGILFSDQCYGGSFAKLANEIG